MSAEKEYTRAHAAYTALAARARAGDRQAHIDKAKAFQEVRNIERQGARDGVILSGGKKQAEAESKKDLQPLVIRVNIQL